MNCFVGILTIALGLTMLPAIAADVTQINRYATVANKPLPAQINPLKAVQQVHFPLEIKIIGQAVDYWLRYSGYHLSEKQDEALQQVLSAPLPQVDRTLGPLSVEAGLLVLVGQGDFELKTSSITREVNFKLRGANA